MGIARTHKDGNSLYLVQDISGFGTYDKAKAIVNFCDKETKRFEKEIDSVILDIFERNGINIPNTDKSVLKLAFDLLKAKGKDIVISDIYKNSQNENCQLIKLTRNHFSIVQETDYVCGTKVEILECGVEVKEKEL